jgi:predicted transcriptional regulator
MIHKLRLNNFINDRLLNVAHSLHVSRQWQTMYIHEIVLIRNVAMRRKIPGTDLLVAFETAARHQSFTRAAEELSLTQSAVCRKISALEDYLGVQLFNRVKKRVTLSSAGQIYARQVRENLKRIEHDTLSLMAHRNAGRVLELAVIPTFANRWLIPRLRNCPAMPGRGMKSTGSSRRNIRS